MDAGRVALLIDQPEGRDRAGRLFKLESVVLRVIFCYWL